MTENVELFAEGASELVRNGLRALAQGGGLATLIVHHPDGTRAFEVQAHVDPEWMECPDDFEDAVLEPIARMACERISTWANDDIKTSQENPDE